jgi:hypothetical protein
VKEFYGLGDSLSGECMFVRDDINTAKEADSQAKSIYYIPPSVCELMKGDREHRLKIVCAGIKVFEKKVHKNNQDVEYRIVQVLSLVSAARPCVKLCCRKESML